MKVVGILVLVGAALAGGYFLGHSGTRGSDAPALAPAAPEAVADARAALRELWLYTGQGPTAYRGVIEFVDRIVGGGVELLPELERAVAEAPKWDYWGSPGTDWHSGVFTGLWNRRTALLEAVARIGGDQAVRILAKAADDRTIPQARDQMAPLSLLARLADREDVRAYFLKRTRLAIQALRNDPAMQHLLGVVRGRLDPAIEPYLVGAIKNGWPSSSVGEKLAQCLYDLDADKARVSLTSLLLDPKNPMTGRKMAVQALARIPEARAATLATILGDLKEPEFLGSFLQGLQRARFGNEDLYYSAIASEDPNAFRNYFEDRKRGIGACRELLSEIEKRLGAEAAKKYGIPDLRSAYDWVEGDYPEKVRRIEASKKLPDWLR